MPHTMLGNENTAQAREMRVFVPQEACRNSSWDRQYSSEQINEQKTEVYHNCVQNQLLSQRMTDWRVLGEALLTLELRVD